MSERPEEINPRREAFRAGLITAAELGFREFAPVRWAVPGLIPEGTTVLAGAPKTGKSWLALGIGLAVAYGGKALGSIDVEAGDVLCLALEDNERRLQRRLSTIQGGGPLPDRLTLVTTAPRIDDGLLPEIERWADKSESPRLVIIDTMQKVRPAATGKLSRYEEDYSVGEALQRLTRSGLAVLVIHHTRKMDAEDPVDMVSGTLGISGGMDGVMVLRRSRAQYDAELFVTGRDIEEETTLALKFTPRAGAWSLLGDAAKQPGGPEQAAILAALKGGPLKPSEIAKTVRKNASTVRTLLERMIKRGAILKRFDGKYELAAADELEEPEAATLPGAGEPSTPSTHATLSTLSTPSTQEGVDTHKRGYKPGHAGGGGSTPPERGDTANTANGVDGVDGVDSTPPSQQRRGFRLSTPETRGVDSPTENPAVGPNLSTPETRGVDSRKRNAYERAKDGEL